MVNADTHQIEIRGKIYRFQVEDQEIVIAIKGLELQREKIELAIKKLRCEYEK